MIHKEPEYDSTDSDLEEMIKSLQVQYLQTDTASKESINIHEIRRKLFQEQDNQPKFKVYTQPEDMNDAPKAIPIKQVFLSSARNPIRSTKQVTKSNKSVSPVSSRPKLSEFTSQAKSNVGYGVLTTYKSSYRQSAQKSSSPINRRRQKLNNTVSQVSKKPPILHIEVNLGSITVNEEVFLYDNPHNIAARLLKPHNSTPKIIQLLSDTIERTINDYTAGITKELASYKRKARVLDWEYRRKLLHRFKPPQLATIKRAETKKQPIGDVKIEIDNCTLTLSVYEGDDPETLSTIFCKEHTLNEESINELKASIRDLIISHQTLLFSLNFEMGEETVSVDIHEKDDLFMVASKFVKEHNLESSNIPRIHKVLTENLEAYKSRSLMSK